MKVLFVSSGNSKSGIGSIIRKQGESLIGAGVEISFLTINRKGFVGYLKSIPDIRREIIKNHFDIIHAHYSFSAFAASLTFSGRPLVASLMGSDSMKNMFWKHVTWIFHKFFWSKTIVKSISMKNSLGISNCEIIPNGVDFNLFKPSPREDSRMVLSLSKDKKYIVFIADPERFEKNYSLAKDAVDRLNDETVELLVAFNITHDQIPLYLNAANVLILTSLWEGSPNVVKEAMACNLPIVSTDVGDVRDVIASTSGCYIAPSEPAGLAEKLQLALAFGKPTNGREKIKHLDEKKIAKRIIGIYENVMEKS